MLTQKLENFENKEDLDELIRIAENQVNRGAELGLNVKNLSDLEIGKIKSKPINLYAALKNSVTYINAQFPEEEIRINIEREQEKIFVKANIFLEEIFKIVLNNAVKYNDNPIKDILIKITKHVKEFSSKIKIEIIDNGIGISDEMKKTIFQPVFQETMDYKRIGLGLLLVNEVIRSFSGEIWVEDKVQDDHTKGSNFIMLIHEASEILNMER